METRKLVKALAGKEDLLVGIGKVQQQRVTGIKDITKINATELMGALVVDTIDDLISLDILELGDTKTVIVKDIDRGGIFIYDESQSTVNDGGVVFNGWVRQYDGVVNIKWFDSITDDIFDKYKFIDLNGKTITTDYSNSIIHFVNGSVKMSNGQPNNNFRLKLNTTSIVTNYNSYVGFLNEDFTDLATRVYILPKDKVTTGGGGILKIFGDAYHLGQEYRDFGIYFYADQAGDTGTHGNGVFWMNSKVSSAYSGANPDIGFSFQDGYRVAGRFVMMKDSSGVDYTTLVVGHYTPIVANTTKDVRLEVQGDIAFASSDDANGIRWLSTNNALDSKIEFLSDGINIKLLGTDSWKIDSSMIRTKGSTGLYDSGVKNNIDETGYLDLVVNGNTSLSVSSSNIKYNYYESYSTENIDVSSSPTTITFSTNAPLKYIINAPSDLSLNVDTSNIPSNSKIYIINTSSLYNITINCAGTVKTIPPLKVGEFIFTGTNLLEIV